MDDGRSFEEFEKERLKAEAEAKERAAAREISQTKAVRCTLLHGSRIGLLTAKKGFGLGLQDDGGHPLVGRLVGVTYAEEHNADSPEASPDRRFGPLQLNDRVVKVGDTVVTDYHMCIEAIKKTGTAPLELTVLRDPNETPSKLWRRDRLWNYSKTGYWAALAALVLPVFGFVYLLSQLEPSPAANATYDHMYPYPHSELR